MSIDVKLKKKTTKYTVVRKQGQLNELIWGTIQCKYIFKQYISITCKKNTCIKLIEFGKCCYQFFSTPGGK